MSIYESEATRQTTDQVLLEIVRIKLSSGLNVNKIDRKLILGYIEAHYGRAKKYRTKENKLYGGTIFGIPYNGSLAGLTLFVSIMETNHDVTIDIGQSVINLSENSDNQLMNLNSSPIDCSANITRNKGRERVGKIMYRISKISIFAEGESRNNFTRKKTPEKIGADELNVLSPLPDFRFDHLLKPVHWERLKGLNLERIVHGVDISTLMTAVDDVALGDVSQEDVDHKLLKTLQLSQYSVQYLLSCQKAMRNNKTIITDTLKVFDDEEALLDVRLARMRARSKALKREDASLDALHTEYSDLLLAIDPTLMKAYKRSLNTEALSSKKRFLNDFVSGVDGGESVDSDDIERERERNKERGKRKGGMRSRTAESQDKGGLWQSAELISPKTGQPSPPPLIGRTDPQHTHDDQDRNAPYLKAVAGDDYWTKQGSWETGSKYRPVQGAPYVQEQKVVAKRPVFEDSESDSEEGSEFHRKGRGQGQSLKGKEKLKQSEVEPVLDRDLRKLHDEENERMSVLFDRPKVTFDSINRTSKSDVTQSQPGPPGGVRDSDESPARHSPQTTPNENRQSGGWSNRASQVSLMSVDSLAGLAGPVKSGKPDKAESQKGGDWAIATIPEKPASYPMSPSVDDVDDVEVIDLEEVPKKPQAPVLRSVRQSDDESSVGSSAVSVPHFAPVAAAISTKWSEQDIGEEIRKNKMYDSDSSNTTSSNPQKNLRSIKTPRSGTPYSDSDSDFQPRRVSLESADAKPDKVRVPVIKHAEEPDTWIAKEGANKFNSFLTSNSKGIAMQKEQVAVTRVEEKPKPIIEAVIFEDKASTSESAVSKTSAYADFIKSGSKGIGQDAPKQPVWNTSGPSAESVREREKETRKREEEERKRKEEERMREEEERMREEDEEEEEEEEEEERRRENEARRRKDDSRKREEEERKRKDEERMREEDEEEEEERMRDVEVRKRRDDARKREEEAKKKEEDDRKTEKEKEKIIEMQREKERESREKESQKERESREKESQKERESREKERESQKESREKERESQKERESREKEREIEKVREQEEAAAGHGMLRRHSQLQDHEDLFERPSRTTLSSTFSNFSTPGGQGGGGAGLSTKQQMDLGRLSKTSSIFNSEDDDDDDFYDDEEGDVIDTSASVILDFYPMERPLAADTSLGIAQIPTTVTTDRANKKTSSKDSTVSFKSAEIFTDLTLSQTSLKGQGDEGDGDDGDWDQKMRPPHSAGGTGSDWGKKAPGGTSKDLQFTMRNSDDRGSSRKDSGVASHPDFKDEEDDDVLYGTTRFGGTRTLNDGYEGTLRSTRGNERSRNLGASTPFGTLLPAGTKLKINESRMDRSAHSSETSADEIVGRNAEDNLDSSYQPSESTNSLNFNLSQSTLLFDVDKMNHMQENKEKRRGGETEDEKPHQSKKKHSNKPVTVNDAKSGLKWRSGRAPTELIETGRAFDVFVSALKLHDESLLAVCLQLEFLGLRSASSPMIPHSAITTVQPVNFSSYIGSAPEITTLLTDEIHAESEYLSFRINLIDADECGDVSESAEIKENVLAQGSVALWVMIEDSCSILRQEVDILDCVSEEIIGFAVVDVRGHRLLKDCS